MVKKKQKKRKFNKFKRKSNQEKQKKEIDVISFKKVWNDVLASRDNCITNYRNEIISVYKAITCEEVIRDVNYKKFTSLLKECYHFGAMNVLESLKGLHWVELNYQKFLKKKNV